MQYYQFAVKFEEFVGSFNTLNGLPNKVCAQNKTEDFNHAQHDYRNK